MKKIVLLPLDERPCNYIFPQKMFSGTDIDLVLPPRKILGAKKTPAKIQDIQNFLFEECNNAFGLVISIDMLLYGGLLSGRLHNEKASEVEARFNILKKLKIKNPSLIIYGFSLIMRCPSYNSSEEEPDYYEQSGESIHRLGKITHLRNLDKIGESEFNAESEKLKAIIGKENLDDYLSRRAFNLSNNLKAIDFCGNILDFLIFPQDDSAEFGYTAIDQESVRRKINLTANQFQAVMYPGADEVGLTLLARMANFIYKREPKVFIMYAAETAQNVIPLYEDRPLGETLKYHIIASGCTRVDSAECADIIFAVSCIGAEMAEAKNQNNNLHSYNVLRNLTEFVLQIEEYVLRGKAVGVCDNAYANGADLELISMLNARKLIPRLAGYAGWNTSSNTAGTVMAQTVLYLLFGLTKEHLDFMAERVIEDAGYCAIVRQHVTQTYIAKNGLDYFLADGERGGAAMRIREELQEFINKYLSEYGERIRLLDVYLPWNRMFEVGISAEYVTSRQTDENLRKKRKIRKSIGIDIGGTEIKGAVLNEDYSIVVEKKVSTNAKSGLSSIVTALDEVISALIESCPQAEGIGIASAGNINAETGEVVYATDNLLGYTGFNIVEHVSRKFNKKCYAENDAYAALLGEMAVGCAKDLSSAVMLTLGTGVGGAIAINGKILHGEIFSAGRLGHTIFVPNGRECNCGQKGCLEQYLSGTAFTLGAIKLGYDISHGSRVFELIKEGDRILENYLIDYLKNLSTFCDTVINWTNPEAIIIGGGMANSDFWFDKYFLPMVKNKSAKFLRATLKNTAGIIGAGSLVLVR